MIAKLNAAEIKKWLEEKDPAKVELLFREADRVRRRFMGDAVHLRGIIEFSNYCRRDCLYCGLRKSNRKLLRYRMSGAEIMQAAEVARELRIPTVVLQSGETGAAGLKEIAAAVTALKKTGLAVTLSLGELKSDWYRRLKDAGADRYLLKFETSDRGIYEKLRPGCRLVDRFKCLEELGRLGFQVGSGSMVGLPGQTTASLAQDILVYERMQFDMIGIGPFIAHPDTPLARCAKKPGLDPVLRMIALTRIVTRDSHMPATTAAASIDPRGREKALRCGANVVMPNISPMKYRQLYQIYPGKVCLSEDARDYYPCIGKMILSAGRTIARGKGDSLKR